MSSASPMVEKDNYFMKIWNETLKGNTFYYPIKISWKSVARFRENKPLYKRVCYYLHNDKEKIDRELKLKNNCRRLITDIDSVIGILDEIIKR